MTMRKPLYPYLDRINAALLFFRTSHCTARSEMRMIPDICWWLTRYYYC